MAIDIKNINEITFTQSFRGYNTEEVDDFLDSLYEEASQNNREIEELKKKIKALESGEGAGSGMSEEEAYSIISNAQEEADRIIETARRKAHSLIESAENQISENGGAPAATAAASSGGADIASLNKLKAVLRETYEKQMAAINEIAGNEPAPEIKKPEVKRDIPTVSFSGITKEFPKKIPAERDILSEINAIGLDGYNASEKNIPIDADEAEATESAEPETGGLSFSFGDHDDSEAEKPDIKDTYKENEPEDPDDIIAQILRDDNRN